MTEKSLRLVSCSMKSLIQEWKPGEDLGLTLAAGNAEQVVVATGKTLIYLSVGAGKVEEIKRTVSDKEISCINVSPLGIGNEKGNAQIPVLLLHLSEICTSLTPPPNRFELNSRSRTVGPDRARAATSYPRDAGNSRTRGWRHSAFFTPCHSRDC